MIEWQLSNEIERYLYDYVVDGGSLCIRETYSRINLMIGVACIQIT